MIQVDQSLSIIIPVLNESKRLPRSLNKIYQFYLDNNINYPIYIVDASSSDNTEEASLTFAKEHQELQLSFLQAGLPHGQKGRQLAFAWNEINTNYSIFMDADLATPLSHLIVVKDMLDSAQKSSQNIDAIIGVRDIKSAHDGFRRHISSIGNTLMSIVGLGDIKDTQCGFKLLSKELSKGYIKHQKIFGWGFDIELLVFSKQNGFDIKTIAIDDWHDVASDKWNSKYKSILYSLKVLKELILIYYYKNRGHYLR